MYCTFSTATIPQCKLRLSGKSKGTAMISTTLQILLHPLLGNSSTSFAPAATIPNHHPFLSRSITHTNRTDNRNTNNDINTPSPASQNVPAGTSWAAPAWQCTGWRYTLWGSAVCCVSAQTPHSLWDFRLLPDWMRRRWPSYLLSLLQEMEGGRCNEEKCSSLSI